MLNDLRTAAASSIGSLFLSSATLVCCALPALAVALGAGAVVASLVSTFPGLVWLSIHKGLVFGAAALGLAVGGALQHRQRFAPCPADPALAAACMRTRRVSSWTYFSSVALFAIGGFFAFVLPWIHHINN
jgi:sorbitol-specific phosphotransferase system component IIBC